MLRRNGPVVKSVESVLRLEGSPSAVNRTAEFCFQRSLNMEQFAISPAQQQSVVNLIPFSLSLTCLFLLLRHLLTLSAHHSQHHKLPLSLTFTPGFKPTSFTVPP